VCLTMATKKVTIKMNKKLKKQADNLFSDLGMSMTTAITAFAKQAVREQRIPFDISRNVPEAGAIKDIKKMKRKPKSCDKYDKIKTESNDPTRVFFEELSPDFVWDLLPFKFLYDIYLAWFKKNLPSGIPYGRNTFIKDIISIAKDSDEWFCASPKTKIRSSNRMGNPEPLIANYCLQNWQNINYKGGDISAISTPTNILPSYRGLRRYSPGQHANINLVA